MKFFLDNNLPPALARSLHALSERSGHQVVHLSEKFNRDIADADWIRALAEEGDWIIVSGDIRIPKNPAERQAWLESGLTSFFLGRGWTGLSFWDQAWKLVQWWPRIIDQAAKVEPPAAFLVPVKGSKFEQLVLSR